MYRSEVSQRCSIYALSLRLATRDAATDILQSVVPGERTAFGPRSPAPQPAPPCFVDCIVDLSRRIRELQSMDCKTVRSLLVPHLDGELAPAQMEWIRTHLEGCAVCSDAAAKLTAQHTHLTVLRPPPMPEGLSAEIWQSMDARLATELAHLDEPNGSASLTTAPVHRRSTSRLPRKALALYAAILGLAVAFGLWRHDAAATAEARVQDLRLKLERAERLRGTPRQMPSAIGNYKTAAYVPGRGHL